MKYLFTIIFAVINVLGANAQFYTIEKQPNPKYVILNKKSETTGKDTIKVTILDSINVTKFDSNIIANNRSEKSIDRDRFRVARNLPKRGESHSVDAQKYSYDRNKIADLTIHNLMDEIEANGILHPKIVLAQAILETGWFTSPVCRNKGNLFGLTNPRTGKYYEYSDWRDSVRAYKTKVQYKYKGGNYLLWLKKLGYAEDPRYIYSLSDIIRQYILK